MTGGPDSPKGDEAPVRRPDTPGAAQPIARQGLTQAEAKSRLDSEGPNEVPEAKDHPILRFALKFWGLSAWMIELIAALSFALGKWADFWVAIGLLVINAVLGFLQESRASAAVAALRRRLQVTPRALRAAACGRRPARARARGHPTGVFACDFVPADATVLEGTVSVDQSALTGESREIARAAGGALYSGSGVRDGEATAIVSATGTRTYYGRTTQLVESAHPKLHVEEVISRVVHWLFLIVGVLVAIAVIVSLAEGFRLLDILPLSLVLLMSAVPVALPVMFTVSMAVGSVALARHGVIVTRLSAAEDAANMDVLCADKTGTLTLNRLSFASVLPQPEFGADEVMRLGALASNEANQDPIDLAFLAAAKSHGLKGAEQVVSFTPFSAKLRRTEAEVIDAGGTLRVMKGALRTLAAMASLDPASLAAIEAQVGEAAGKGYRAIAVACAVDGAPLRLAGVVLLADALRSDSGALIGRLKSLGVAVKMLTGDALPVAREIGGQLGLPGIVRAPDLRAAVTPADRNALVSGADGFAEIFPEDKFLVVQSLQAAGHVAGMTGDGVNDAPALRQAEVGIAVSGATDVARGAASVVLTTEGLSGIVDLVTNGRAIYQRVLTWIVNKVSRTILKAGFVVAAFLVTGQFVISALGMVLVVFMTDFVKIALSTDRVRSSQKPETWNIGPLVSVAVVLGLLMMVEALGLLAIGWHWFRLGNDAGRLQTFTFQTLLFFALFSIVSIRERRAFWRSRPSKVLGLALIGDGLAGLVIGMVGLGDLKPLALSETAIVVVYAFLLSLLVNDVAKVALIGLLKRIGTHPRLTNR